MLASSLSQWSNSRNLVRGGTAAILCLLLWHMWTFSHSIEPFVVQDDMPAEEAVCPPLEGFDDVFVVFKTGATETTTKLPIHFSTTLRCVPHYAIFSDYAEEVDGHHVYNALDEVNEEIKLTHPDFELYNRLQQGGRETFTEHELQKWFSAANTKSGMTDNPAWRLDKWKFLPLIDKALNQAPDAKWFVFVEADTYMMWHNLLEWLSHFDPEKPWYIGEPMQIGPDTFAYGGAGFIISNPAMRIVSDHRAENLDAIDEFTAGHWAGDCVLGKVMHNAGIPLTWGWPNIQSGRPSDMEWEAERKDEGRLWCHRAVSYHHLSNDEIEYFYRVEKDARESNTSLLRHRDVFQDFVLSQVSSSKPDWDNLATHETFLKMTKKGLKIGKPIKTYGDCRLECDQYGDCIGFSWINGTCNFNTKFQLGHRNVTSDEPDMRLTSGFMTDRVDWMVRWLEDEPCRPEEQWTLPGRP